MMTPGGSLWDLESRRSNEGHPASAWELRSYPWLPWTGGAPRGKLYAVWEAQRVLPSQGTSFIDKAVGFMVCMPTRGAVSMRPGYA